MNLRRVCIVLALAWAPLFGCAAHRPAAREPLSADAHRREAGRERMLADEAYAHYQPLMTAPMPGAGGGGADVPRLSPFTMYPFNPTINALKDAERHLRHAREHEQAAQALEQFESAECSQFSAKARAACPVLGPVAAIEDLPDGVRFRLAAGAPIEAVIAHMRCHLAFARARGFPPSSDCPLYMRGVEISLSADGGAIELRSRDSKVVRALWVQSRTTTNITE
jgi:hypothetical protein